MSTRTLAGLAATAALAAAAPAAQADTLLHPVSGARGLAAGGGWLAWAQPEGERWRLALRAPDGTVTTPVVGSFAAPPDVGIGSDRTAFPRRLFAVYARGGDIVRLNLRSGRETPYPGVNTDAREGTPSLRLGGLAFTRDGDVWVARRGARPRRVADTDAREVAFNGSRVAYATARSVVVRRVSGEGTPLRVRARATSLVLTRYHAAWLGDGGVLQRTERLRGSRPAGTVAPRHARRRPEGVTALAVGQSIDRAYLLTAEGVVGAAGVLR